MSETIWSDVGGNRAEFDREKTIAVYATIPDGFSDTSDLAVCENYRKIRSRSLFPASMLAACDAIGIDVLKEGEQSFDTAPGLFELTVFGAFYFAGTLLPSAYAPPMGPQTDGWMFDDWTGVAWEPDPGFDQLTPCIVYRITIPWVLRTSLSQTS